MLYVASVAVFEVRLLYFTVSWPARNSGAPSGEPSVNHFSPTIFDFLFHNYELFRSMD
jgi:hypothetical protein